LPGRDHIDDADGDALLEQGRALPDESIALLRPILVPWADQFNGGDELPTAFHVVDANGILVVIGNLGFDGDGRFGRRPHGRRRTCVVRTLKTGRVITFVGGDVHFDLRAGMYGGGGDIALGKALAKLPHNLCRPHAVQGVPGGLEAHRGAKVIAERHGNLLHHQCTTTDQSTRGRSLRPESFGEGKGRWPLRKPFGGVLARRGPKRAAASY
jgi:hypothetical protein